MTSVDDVGKTILRNMLLGRWAAEKLGITGRDAEAYSDALARGTVDPERSDVMGDALGSVAAILAAACMSLFGWYAADAVFSVVISLLIIWASIRLIRESTNVLLEGTPAHINLAAVEDAILATDGVADVHDLHVWTITSGREALSAHVIHAHSISQPDLLRELRAKLHDRFGVDHLTIQMETPDFEDETFHFCHAGTACFRSERN